MNKIPFYPSPEVKAFGELVNESMYDASIRMSMAGLGGCKEFKPEDFDPEVLPYINAYAEGENDSVALTYAAMRAKDVEGRSAPTVEAAKKMGATGGPTVEEERLAFEAWVKGHCWSLNAEWNGSSYVHASEVDGEVYFYAMLTRMMWAAWRDRAALERIKEENDADN